ncbi:DEAD/DEAH box helicase [Cohnella algarum]|uniref:DEAD/DEAH box helicase n=1 Tax=Cohnella algarum TaxID=2044859 RepID=UPI00308457E2
MALANDGCAYPQWTVSWEADLAFWAGHAATSATEAHKARSLVRLRLELPLSEAVIVCDSLKARLGGKIGPGDAGGLLLETAEAVRKGLSRERRNRLSGAAGMRRGASGVHSAVRRPGFSPSRSSGPGEAAGSTARDAFWGSIGGPGGSFLLETVRVADLPGLSGLPALPDLSDWTGMQESAHQAIGNRADDSLRPAVARGRGVSAGEGAAWRSAAREAGRKLAGRSLLLDEAIGLLGMEDSGTGLFLLQFAALAGEARLAAAMESGAGRRAKLRCRRCGSGEERMRRTACASCGSAACAVCEACIAMGRSRECGLLVLGLPRRAEREQPSASVSGRPLPADGRPRSLSGSTDFSVFSRPVDGERAPLFVDRWGLSPAQLRASEAAVRFLRGDGPGEPLNSLNRLLPRAFRRSNRTQSRRFLLWAVTGAGKTEMIFPLLQEVLDRGGRTLVATPRRDVVLELAPRLAKAFPDVGLAVLYGGSEDRWTNAPLTLATTHQLLRFQEAFDLVLVDELDAFPYHNDPMLHYAAEKARRADGSTVFLSATPPASMQREVKRGGLPCARVPVRFHRHPLPVPVRLNVPPIYKWIGRGQVPASLKRLADESVRRGAQLFVFVPYIRHVDPVVSLLRRHAGEWGIAPEAIGGTSSKDAERSGKVTEFRNRSFRVLVTTTILERGVTVPRSDVCILDAHHAMFDEAALVQMAGRAGRSGEDPKGRVYFCSAYATRSQHRAESQIQAMNRLARKLGYIRTAKDED